MFAFALLDTILSETQGRTMSWWNRERKATHDADVIHDFCASLKQGETILKAEQDGRKAWRMLMANHMLGEQYLLNRQYKFNNAELAYFSGVAVENISVGASENRSS